MPKDMLWPKEEKIVSEEEYNNAKLDDLINYAVISLGTGLKMNLHQISEKCLCLSSTKTKK